MTREAGRLVVSDLVDLEEIEGIVGVKRDPTLHWGRADSTSRTVFVLHSQECRDSGADLRECSFSLALDRGITEDFGTWLAWSYQQDRPVGLEVCPRGFLRPRLVRRVGRGG